MLINIIIKVSLKVSFICHFDRDTDTRFMIIWSDTFDTMYNPNSDPNHPICSTQNSFILLFLTLSNSN